MNLRRAFLFLGLALLASLSLAGCRKERVAGSGCIEDKDCGLPASAFRCETRTGQCYCRTDEACHPRELCNPSGFCQDRAGCETNADCDESQFCETQSGSCLPKGRCSTDLHCPLGQVCDADRATCVDGCHSNGDCPGSSCRCGEVPCACTGTTPADVAQCTVGVCDPHFCADQNFCKFGELCGLPPDAGATRNECYSDFDDDRRPYCANCNYGAGTNICGRGANYCLIDTTHPGNYYCGTDCSQGQSCPRGYGCQDVIVVFTQWACSRSNPSCPSNPQMPCVEDKDCRRGGTCAKLPGSNAGLCAGVCSISEGDNDGFCSCLQDTDCAPETCSGGECSISRRKCIGDADCRSIRCVDFEGAGGCLIGQNCAPADGLSCLEVQ